MQKSSTHPAGGPNLLVPKLPKSACMVFIAMLLCLILPAAPSLWASYCPFCSAVKQTLSEEMLTTDAVVLAKIVGPAKVQGKADAPMLDLMMEMQVTKIIKGKTLVAEGKTFTTVVPPSFTAGQECLVMGVVTDQLSWSTPVKMTDRSRDYILELPKLPEDGPERLQFFLSYLEDPESLLAYDAYDEFARAPYATVQALKEKMDREQLLKWIADPEVTINRKRLYYTMLGVCGTEKDLPFLEKMITSEDKRERAALDALSACYLTLAGEKGVKLIEDQFLRNKNAEYVDTYSAVAALRFHGTESDIIPVPRILKALHLLLDRPDIADLVIPDLARWEDWTVIDKLVQMFKDADEESKWVRVPIINYLRECPKPEAARKIEELREVDPQSVRRALLFFDASPNMDDDPGDADFDKQLDQLENGKKDKSDKKEKGGESTSKTVALRPVVPMTAAISQEDTVDGDQALRLDPFAQPIATSIEQDQDQAIEQDQLIDAPVKTLEYHQEDGTDEIVVKKVTTAAAFPNPVVSEEPKPQDEASEPVNSAATMIPEIRTAKDSSTDRRTASSKNVDRLAVSPPSGELPKSYTWWIVGVPMAINALLLVLAWSIFNGTFSRLFC